MQMPNALLNALKKIACIKRARGQGHIVLDETEARDSALLYHASKILSDIGIRG